MTTFCKILKAYVLNRPLNLRQSADPSRWQWCCDCRVEESIASCHLLIMPKTLDDLSEWQAALIFGGQGWRRSRQPWPLSYFTAATCHSKRSEESILWDFRGNIDRKPNNPSLTHWFPATLVLSIVCLLPKFGWCEASFYFHQRKQKSTRLWNTFK